MKQISILLMLMTSLLLSSCANIKYKRATEQYEQAMLYIDSLKNEDSYAGISDALDKLRKAAKSDYADAQYELGKLYLNNHDSLIPVDIDTSTAIFWFKKAADAGCHGAESLVGLYCYTGEFLPLDKQKAVSLWQKAAESGDSESQYRIGLAYMYGISGIVPQNFEEAVKWLEAASGKGHFKACCELGDYHMRLYDEKKDRKEVTAATSWYEKSLDIKTNILAVLGLGGTFFSMFADMDNIAQASAVAVPASEYYMIADQLYGIGNLDGLEMDPYEMDLIKGRTAEYPDSEIKFRIGLLNSAIGIAHNNTGILERGIEYLHKSAALGNSLAVDMLHELGAY